MLWAGANQDTDKTGEADLGFSCAYGIQKVFELLGSFIYYRNDPMFSDR